MKPPSVAGDAGGERCQWGEPDPDSGKAMETKSLLRQEVMGR